MDGNSTGGTIIATKDFIVRNQADTQTMIQGIEGGGSILYYAGNRKIESTNGGGIVRGGLEVTEDLQVNDDATINDSLTVGGNANFAGNTVQITANTVTANRFAGTADVAERAPVHGTDGQGLGNADFALMMSLSSLSSGTVQKLSRDQNIKFNTGSNELRCDG